MPSSDKRGQQVTADENHYIRQHEFLQKNRGFGDVGGSFYSTKSYVSTALLDVKTLIGERLDSGDYHYTKYNGPIYATPPQTTPIPSHSLSNLSAKGTTAIARCKPTNNVANLATSLTEVFREGLPSLWGAHTWKDRTHVARNAGDEYLNHTFGWLPLVSDVRNASYAAANSHRLLSSYESNSGKLVRRRYEFPVEKTETTVDLGLFDGYTFCPTDIDLFGGQSQSLQPRLTKTTRTSRRIWFSGAFTYHLPAGYTNRNRMARAAAKAGPLLGIELTPEVIWNASPWTWAVDWFSNAGDVVSNVSDWSTDGLVLRHGYIMEHIVTTVQYALDRPTRIKPLGSIFASPVTAYLETKRREKATPFGFEIGWNGLSPRQLAIAAALGITRVF